MEIKVFTFLLGVLALGYSYGQNLIPNGSFEKGECPIKHSVRPSDFQVEDWFVPDGSTPDYYHRCGNEDAGIPKNWAGNRSPMEGDAYVGIYLKKGKYQENLGTSLLDKLVKDSTYILRFSVANVANADFLASEISIAFTDTLIRMNHINEYDHRQITFRIPEPKNFNDFSWRTFTLEYKASGHESYFYIGPLKNPGVKGSNNKYRILDEPMLNNAPYVFVDEITLKPLFGKPQAEPQFQLSRNIDPITILFDFDEAVPKNIDSLRLDTLKSFIERHSLHLLITGSTDSVGTKSYNLSLGKQRAETVKDLLSFSGINNWRMEAVSKGEETSKYSNHSEEYRRLNRSAIIEFYFKE